ncbi:hypothetical protein [Flavilitoribacter nigricans]|uniref:Uncharacterized protein n=1 Tax=Flavilitoribacter nigricans (strain ATCC 23147 / DSM 23189 / NBRC 102662 / NCIMB 1420 / SS-2) TaxID=1122177 RepID=A0A2D0N3W0_FLAN2|nr:hypothetical protein [Flavilitoribacter nigricans]PHN03195.1 hypothetical protein CRP01_27765 [Flavilitoribacter nigricans DSM 23189 = NBRC 102662]
MGNKSTGPAADAIPSSIITALSMLLTKRLFNRIRQINWNMILLELFIVFVGVYLAFLLGNYQEKKRIASEAEKIYTSLKVELEGIRFNFPQRAAYQRSRNVEWDSLWDQGGYAPLYQWRYIQPQYDFTTIEYALKAQGSTIVNFELYESLTELYQGIKRLEHQELLLTDIGMEYRNVPADSNMPTDELAIRNADNRLLFYKFIDLSKLRAEVLGELVTHANNSLQIIDNRLGKDDRRRIEMDLIRENLPRLIAGRDLPEAMIKKQIEQQFPSLRERDIRQLMEELPGDK